MDRNRATIKDIAEELNLSSSTVSRALSDRGRISQQVRTEVLNLARRWGYTRNPFALNLHNNRSNHIGLILPEFTHHYFSQALKGIDQVVNEKGYHLIVNTHNNDCGKEANAAKALNGLLIDGMIVSHAGNNGHFQYYKELMLSGVPVVFFDRLFEDLNASYIITDDFSGAQDAIDYLVNTGCKKIAYFCGPSDISTNFHRQMGYQEGIRKRCINTGSELIFPWDSDNERLKAKMKLFFTEHQIDGIFCFSDYIAYDALCVLCEMGINVPNQVSIIGFADEPVSSYCIPRISTIHQSAEMVGRRAAEILFWHLENPNDENFIIERLPTRLILRESTKKPLNALNELKE